MRNGNVSPKIFLKANYLMPLNSKEDKCSSLNIYTPYILPNVGLCQQATAACVTLNMRLAMCAKILVVLYPPCSIHNVSLESATQVKHSWFKLQHHLKYVKYKILLLVSDVCQFNNLKKFCSVT